LLGSIYTLLSPDGDQAKGREKLISAIGQEQFDAWMEQAKSARPELSESDREALVLSTHRGDVGTALGRSGVDAGIVTQIDTLISGFAFPPALTIPLDPVAPIPAELSARSLGTSVRDAESIRYGLVPSAEQAGEPLRIVVEGSTVRSGDQVYDASALPPRKFIELSGLRIESGAEYEAPYALEAERGRLIYERDALRGEIGREGDAVERLRESVLPRLETELGEMSTGTIDAEARTLLMQAYAVFDEGTARDMLASLRGSGAQERDREFLKAPSPPPSPTSRARGKSPFHRSRGKAGMGGAALGFAQKFVVFT